MKFFINDIPVNIIKANSAITQDDFDVIIDGGHEKIQHKKLVGKVIIREASEDQIDRLLKLMTFKKFKNLNEISFEVVNRRAVIVYVKSKFKTVKAAGGLVVKDNRYLMIYRQKKWDLPKGKLDNKEKSKIGAVREVEEECNIKVELGPKIYTTWHTYISNGKYTLKRTKWYVMYPLDDSKMKPQIEENIEEVRYLNEKELKIALFNSYRTIEQVVMRYKKMAEVKKS